MTGIEERDDQPTGEPWTGRPLRLRHPPDVESAPATAADIVTASADVDGVHLDYTPQSLELVDQILDRFHQERLGSDLVAETLWGFGCYLGEVLVRNAGGRWIATPADARGRFDFPIVLQRDERLCNPIGKAFKRVDNGPEDSLVFFYTVFGQG